MANATRTRMEISRREIPGRSEIHPSVGFAMTAPMPKDAMIEPATTGDIPYCRVIRAFPQAPNPTVAQRPPHPAIDKKIRLRLRKRLSISFALFRVGARSPPGRFLRNRRETMPQANVAMPSMRKALDQPYWAEIDGTIAFASTTASDVAVVYMPIARPRSRVNH